MVSFIRSRRLAASAVLAILLAAAGVFGLAGHNNAGNVSNPPGLVLAKPVFAHGVVDQSYIRTADTSVDEAACAIIYCQPFGQEFTPSAPVLVGVDVELVATNSSGDEGKVTSFRNREHYSTHGFLWPIGHTVHDPNAKEEKHGPCLHFTASGASAYAPGFSSYGSHPLVVLPAPQLWDDPLGKAGLTNRCWHSCGGVVLFCAACLNLKPEDLKNPAFWQELTKPQRRRAAVTPDDFFDLRIPRNAIWHREEKVAANAGLAS